MARDFRCQGSILRRIRCPIESPGVLRSLGDILETEPNDPTSEPLDKLSV